MQKKKDTTDKDDEKKIRKSKRTKCVATPSFKIGDRVVLKSSYGNDGKYLLILVMDVVPAYRRDRFKYYGRILQVNHLNRQYMINHLADFSNGYLGSYSIANVPEDSVKWLKETP